MYLPPWGRGCASPRVPQLGPLAGPYHEGFYPCRRGRASPPGRPFYIFPYLTVPLPHLTVSLLLGGCLVLLRRKTIRGLCQCGWMPPGARIPLTLPVADKVPVPPSPKVLRGVPMHQLLGRSEGK